MLWPTGQMSLQPTVVNEGLLAHPYNTHSYPVYGCFHAARPERLTTDPKALLSRALPKKFTNCGYGLPTPLLYWGTVSDPTSSEPLGKMPIGKWVLPASRGQEPGGPSRARIPSWMQNLL